MRHKAELLFTTESCQDSLAIQKSVDEAIADVFKKENVKFSIVTWHTNRDCSGRCTKKNDCNFKGVCDDIVKCYSVKEQPCVYKVPI